MNLKSALITIVLLIVLTRSENAQDQSVQVQLYYEQVVFPFFGSTTYKNSFSYRFGSTIGYHISRRVSVTTGIGYESRKYYKQYSGRDTPTIKLTKEEFEYSHIGIPLTFGFDIIQLESHTFGVSPGFELQRLLHASIDQFYSDGIIESGLDKYSSYEYAAYFNVAAVYQYFFNRSYFLTLSPKFRSITSLGGNADFSFLFQVSLGYTFIND